MCGASNVRWIGLLALFAAVWSVVSGCGGSSASAVAPVSDLDEVLPITGDGDFAAIVAEAEAHWANRLDRTELDAAIAAWERALHVNTPGNRGDAVYPVLCMLARASYFTADGHIRFEDSPDREQHMKDAYQRGIEYARLALSINNEEWNRQLLYEHPIPDAVQVTTRDDIPAMYWYSTNLGRWALLDGTPTVLAHKDDIAAVMGRILDLDANYFYGAAHRYFGVYYTRIPIGAPDLERSRTNFEAAIAIEPNYLSTHVLFAEEYATKTQDRALFEEQLNYVMNADPTVIPEVEPENRVEQHKAELLLANIDELFR